MADLKPCPFCGREDLTMVECEGEFFVGCYGCTTCGPAGETEETAAEAWNRRVDPAPKKRPEPNLDGKCGSCEHSVMAVGHFGNSKCYVECTNQTHLAGRRYYGRPLVAIRQRTAKGCKHYKRRDA